MAFKAAPFPGTPFRPSSPCQMTSNADMRSLITMTASDAFDVIWHGEDGLNGVP